MDYLWVLICAIAFIAAVLQSLSGFGAGLIAVPMLSLLIPMTDMTTILSLQSLLLAGVLSWKLKQYIHINKLLPLFVMACIFTPVGVLSLLVIDLGWLKLILGLLVFTSGLLLMGQRQLPLSETPLNYGIVGTISGWLNGVATLSGPPIVLFLANQGKHKMEFRALLSFYFFVLAIANLVVLSLSGVTGYHNLSMGLLAWPGTLLGTIIGAKLIQYVNEVSFRQGVILLISVMGLVMLINGLLQLS